MKRKRKAIDGGQLLAFRSGRMDTRRLCQQMDENSAKADCILLEFKDLDEVAKWLT